MQCPASTCHTHAYALLVYMQTLFLYTHKDICKLTNSLTHSLTHTHTHTAPQQAFDASSLHQRGKREAQQLVDDGTGKVQIWRVEDLELVSVPKGMYGQFFGGDSYVILYTYVRNGKECYIIYFWQGQVKIYITSRSY